VPWLACRARATLASVAFKSSTFPQMNLR
jgi:hypothetical protein